MVRSALLFAGVASIAVLSCALPAHAQEDLDGSVPLMRDLGAVTAISGERLEILGVHDLSRMSDFTPGLLVQNKSAADSRLVIRGLASGDGSSFQEPRVAVLLDGVPLSKSRGAFVELFDVSQVQVARGPQTTLFGHAAFAGAVSIVQNKADASALDWALGGEVGDHFSRLATGFLNLPITETLAVRFAGQYRGRDGTLENVLGGEDFGGFEAAAGRIAIAFDPSDALSFDFIAGHQRDEATGRPLKSGVFFPSNPFQGVPLANLDPSTGAALDVGDNFDGGRKLGLERDMTHLSLGGVLRLSDGVTLTSTTAWRRFESYEAVDVDGFGLPLMAMGDDVIGESASQDLRIAFQASDRLDLVAGVFAMRETGRQRTPIQIDERLMTSLLSGALDPSDPDLGIITPYIAPPVMTFGLLDIATARGQNITLGQATTIARNLGAHEEVYTDTAENRTYDAYLDAAFQATDRLKLTAGVRYSTADRESGFSAALPSGRSILGGYLAALSTPQPARNTLLNALGSPGARTLPAPLPMTGLRVQPTAGGATERATLDDEGFTWRLAGQYEISSDLTMYASYARGRRPQVLAPRAPSSPNAPAMFDAISAETLDSYEVGARFRSPESRLSLDAALYAYDYSHFQTSVQQGAQVVTTDAGRATNLGLELEASYQAMEGLRLFGTYAASRARFRDGLFRDNHLTLSPDHGLGLGAELEHGMFGGTIRAIPMVRYQSKTYFTDDNADQASGYVIADLRLDYFPAQGAWSAGVFATNLFDEDYVAGSGGEELGLPTYLAGTPRVVGVSVRLRR